MAMLEGNQRQSFFRQRMVPVTVDGATTLNCLYSPYGVLVVVNNQLLDRSQVNTTSGTQLGFSRPLSLTDRVVVLDLPQVQTSPGIGKLIEAYSTYNKINYATSSFTLNVLDAYGTIVCQPTTDVTYTLPASDLMTDGAHLTFILDSDYEVTLQAQTGDLIGLGASADKFVLTERGTHVELVATTRGWFIVDTNHYSLMNYRAVVGAIETYPSRDLAAPGTIFADGQALNRATYPSLFKLVEQGKVPTVSEATWQADPSKRNCYTLGNGSTTFRVPDYNGVQSGSVAAFMRGDGNKSAGLNGGIQKDAIRDIVGRIENLSDAGTSTLHTNAVVSGAFSKSPITGNRSVVQNSTGSYAAVYLDFKASSALPAGNTTDPVTGETRPSNFSVVFAIRAFGTVVNVGSADAAQLATDVANIRQRMLPLFFQGIHNGTRQGLQKTFNGMATPNDGIVIQASSHPELVRRVLRGDVATCTEAQWQADPYQRSKWSTGTAAIDESDNPTGWVRTPDLNQALPDSLPPPFARGGADAKVGSIGKDTMREISATAENIMTGDTGISGSGAFQDSSRYATSAVSGGTGSRSYSTLRFNASDALPEGHVTDSVTGEFAPWHVYGVSYTITSNGVVNEAAIDAGQVMGEVLLNRGRINVLESNLPTKGSNGDGTAHWQIIDGVITQWGYTDAGVGGDGVRTITFPIPFPEKVTGVSVTRQLNSVSSDSWGVVVGMPTATSMVIGAAYSAGVPDTARLFWEVKGR